MIQENERMKFDGVVRVPKDATLATVRLFLRWEPKAKVEWSEIDFRLSNEPKPRKVRLAATNFRPTGGKSAIENCRMFAPFIKKAAEKNLVIQKKIHVDCRLSRSHWRSHFEKTT